MCEFLDREEQDGMAPLFLTYYGHACFKLSYGGKSVLFDPYQDGSVPGLKLPRGICVDALYCSHDHADHCARGLVEVTAKRDPFPVHRMRVPHDDAKGRKRGMCDVVMVSLGGVNIAHLGDYGRLPTEGEYAFLRKADILLVPCGGFYTIGPLQARELIARSGAALSILMHFRKGCRGYGVLSDISEIRKVFGSLEEKGAHTISLDSSHIPSGVLTLEPLQE